MTTLPANAAHAIPLKEQFRRARSGLMYWLCIAAAAFIIAVLGAVVAYLVWIGGGAITPGLFTKVPSGDVADPGGMANAIVGTLILVGLASLVGIPVGVLTGVYLSEYSTERWLVAPVRFVCDVLAGVPSIVVGILGYELLVVPMGHFNGWAGAMSLAFIMVPIVARTTEEMLLLVPASYRAASLALGATKAQTILRVVIPAATGSMITGVMLAMARVAGETAPLLFTALGSRFMPFWVNAKPPFVHGSVNQPFPSLTVQIFSWATGPYEAQRRLAWAGILVLVAMLFVLNLAIRYTASRAMRRTR